MYLGNNLVAANSSYRLIDSLTASFNGTTTSFALTVNGVTPVPFPLNEQNVLISVGGVPQKPDPTGAEGFKFSGSNIVFSSAPKTGEAFWGVILAGADYIAAGVSYPDGSASAPSITFGSQNTTGLYRPASGQLGVALNGVNTATFSSSGLTLNGATSGYSLLAPPAVAGDQTFSLPSTGGTLDRLNRAGNILQVVQTVKSDTFSTSSTSFTDVTGLSASITPASASNKVLVIIRFTHSRATAGTGTHFRITRGGTAIFVGDSASSRDLAATGSHYLDYYNQIGETITFLDSPSTTSSISYALQGRSGGSNTLYVNKSGIDADRVEDARTASSIILLEVAA